MTISFIRWLGIAGLGTVLVVSACKKSSGESTSPNQEESRPLNMAVIKGTDSNSNGVRDDVEEMISKNYSKTEVMKLAAMQDARALQKAIENPENAMEISVLVSKAVDCAGSLSDKGVSFDMGRAIEAETTNNAERAEAYLRFNLNLSGHVFSPSYDSAMACDFDVSKAQK